MEKIGDICENGVARVIEWKIKNFFSLYHAVNTRYDSPDFYFSGISWNLRIYPNGETRNNSLGFINVYLARMSSGASVILDYSIALKSTDRHKDIVQQAKSSIFDDVHIGKGFKKLISRLVLIELQRDIAPFAEITIICTMKNTLINVTGIGKDKGVQTEFNLNTNVSIENLINDYSVLLDSGPNHDAEIKCGEISMKVHKIILGARSEVFKAMLENDMQEGRTGVVEIKDMDPLYIHDFIKYLYTGSISEMTFEKSMTQNEAGDKYAVSSLILRCSEFLQNNLSTEVACQCLAVADAHCDEKLKNKVTNYILDERIFLQDEIWLPFCENYPRLANEVYRLFHMTTKVQNV